jgi:hypothetical protein
MQIEEADLLDQTLNSASLLAVTGCCNRLENIKLRNQKTDLEYASLVAARIKMLRKKRHQKANFHLLTVDVLHP